jgi:SAM-dependent methyltransferase
MVRQAEANARAAGLADFEGRTGFGEDPPFPRDGEPPFDLVLSSGVISFSPDPERWLDGLARSVAPGGTLVVGDVHAGSRGVRARRRRRPLLPVRELNAKRPEDVRAALERRGFRCEAGAGYQLTWPIPEAMHVNETRLGGVLTHPLLWLNRGAAALDGLLGSGRSGIFDSWVMRLRAPG